MWKTIIEIKPVDLSRVNEMCNAIAKKDKTFSYEIEERKYALFLHIYSKGKDQAHKRGLLLTKKYLPVEEGDDYLYWIEEGGDR